MAALIEKAPRDLPLYASYILRIIYIILQARDITTVESSLPTFMSFCQHHDGASLSADQEYLCQYEEVVNLYASFASASFPSPNISTDTPVSLRWRNAGLQAIKSIYSSEALAAVADRQLDLIVPTLLQNIWPGSNDYINQLVLKAQAVENPQKNYFSQRSTSVATVQTVEAEHDTQIALSGTSADDADKVAEEDIGALALLCLKLVFMVNNKSQIHIATVATLKFIMERLDQEKSLVSSENRAIKIFKLISSWAPVQDRYTILITAMEILVNSPLEDVNLLEQLLLAIMMDSLLKSEINLIGLSVMDILLGLIQHMLRVLQLNYPSPQLTSNSTESQWPLNCLTETCMDSSLSAELLARKLVEKLQECIGNLATHIYYADQISDMVAAILWRLKPGQALNILNPVAHAENTTITTTVNHASDVSEDVTTDDGIFNFAVAKLRALEAIKSILITASCRKSLSSVSNLVRDCVPSRVWEGTQWLLRDSDGGVRKAYVATLLTWMEHETTVSEIRMCEKNLALPLRSVKDDSAITSTGRRAISSTPQKDKIGARMPTRSKFLELLHLAIYENALKHSESEEDILMLHLLLTSLVENLGVDAVKNGLPMIFHLQDDVPEASTPLAKVLLGSLCHGYFWALSEKFELRSAMVDQEIYEEIHRRQENHCWVDRVRYPPIPLEHIRVPDREASPGLISFKNIGPETLQPFRNRSHMVELISSHVEASMLQSTSLPSSPIRSLTQSCLGNIKSNVAPKFSEEMKEQMLSEWSQSSVIEAVQESSGTLSLNGSKDGTVATKHRNLLSANGNNRIKTLSPNSNSLLGHKVDFRSASSNGFVSGLTNLKKLRRSSPRFSSPLSMSSHNSVTRVEHLKRILSGQGSQTQWNRTTGNSTPSDSSSESMVSYAYTVSDISLNRSQSLERSASDRLPSRQKRMKSGDEEILHASPLTSNPSSKDDKIMTKIYSQDVGSIPPMPCIPMSYKDRAVAIRDLTPAEDIKTPSMKKQVKSYSEIYTKESLVSLESFLNQIEAGPDGVSGDVARPPY